MLVQAQSAFEPKRQTEVARLIIAEDHPVMCAGLIDLLKHETDIELRGCAASAFEVENLVRRHDPHVLVLDLSLGSDDGAELARRLLRERPRLRIVVLSVHDELVFGDKLLAMGVLAYVTKDRTRSEFLLALRSALSGRVYYTEQQRKRLEAFVVAPNSLDPQRVLSEREIAVLRLLGSGKACAAIAPELSMATKTVYSHRRNISAKLGIGSGRELVRYAVRWMRALPDST